MPPDERNLDVLQNLEYAIVNVWRKHPEMTDYVAARAYEAAFERYRAEARGHLPKTPHLTGLDQTAFDAVTDICEFRLGRGAGSLEGMPSELPIPPGQLVDCLRELKKSVERHTRSGGRQGYLTFVNEFLP